MRLSAENEGQEEESRGLSWISENSSCGKVMQKQHLRGIKLAVVRRENWRWDSLQLGKAYGSRLLNALRSELWSTWSGRMAKVSTEEPIRDFVNTSTNPPPLPNQPASPKDLQSHQGRVKHSRLFQLLVGTTAMDGLSPPCPWLLGIPVQNVCSASWTMEHNPIYRPIKSQWPCPFKAHLELYPVWAVINSDSCPINLDNSSKWSYSRILASIQAHYVTDWYEKE